MGEIVITFWEHFFERGTWIGAEDRAVAQTRSGWGKTQPLTVPVEGA